MMSSQFRKYVGPAVAAAGLVLLAGGVASRNNTNKKGIATNPEEASSPADVFGEREKLSTKMLQKGAAAMQNFDPLKQICQHLCAFHYYANDMTRQVEAHHYCTHYNEDMHQCLIYDTDQKNARLIGVEFILSEKIFNTLPDEEKKLWHSHEYEVKSGELFMPRLPETAEHAVMKQLVKTYGKTWHFWQYDRGDPLPLGVPQLMGAFTRDGQLLPHVAESAEKRYGVSFADKRAKRADLEGPEGGVHHMANSWEKTGKGLVLEPRETKLKKI